MSASRQKKLRQEQAASAPTTKRRAVTEEEKAAKRLKIWSAVFYVIIGLMVIGIAVAAIANTGVLERTLTAVTIGNRRRAELLLPGHRQQHHEQQLHDELHGHQRHAPGRAGVSRRRL